MSLPQINSLRSSDATVGASASPRRFTYLNLPLILVVVLLVAYGLINLYPIVLTDDDYSFSRQCMGVAIGLVCMAIIWCFDYRRLAQFTLPLLIVNVLLILSPHIPGLGTDAGTGAQSWINIGMQIQPGEFAKLTVVLLDASAMARYGGKLDDVRDYLKVIGIILIPFICIMTQPDLGTGLVYLFIGATALVMGGARPKFLLVTLAACVVALVAVFAIDEVFLRVFGEYKLLQDYQRSRLLVFLDSDSVDLASDGYNLRQAQIAIGSGGLFGKGLFNASQASLGYLPEAPTDFIFCALAEQLGFVGVSALLILYIMLIAICFGVARSAGDLFGMVIVMCAVGMWLFQILENIGMTCGLMPITGIPLPFMSYGSSFMVVNFMLVGLVGSVWAHNGRSGA